MWLSWCHAYRTRIVYPHMKNINITRKISQGMYVLTTKNGGCIVDAVSQISSGENPLISVSVMKKKLYK